MIFTTIPFLFFLIVVFGTYWSLRADVWRQRFLFAANFFFYGWWNWKFTVLLFASILISYVAGILMERTDLSSQKRKWIMLSACIVLLCMLGYFKYANFFLTSLHATLESLGGHFGWRTLEIILPAGISFYIFQAISYVVSVYRRTIPAEPRFIRLGVYLSFFPHLVAGPIIHASTFLPQLASKRHFDSTRFVEGTRKFALGFLYKAVFADNLAESVNMIFLALKDQSPLTIFGGCLGFYGQIYFDFAGYSLMAIGVANLLGYTLPDNFNFPYRATSLIDFWRRWHISLSTWLRDYVYIPLGGNRCNRFLQYRNIVITMFLGGLWHGANWNFVLWGGMHGLALCLNHAYRGLREKFGHPVEEDKIIAKTASWILTQGTIFCCWIPFRAATLSDTIFIFHQLGKLYFLTISSLVHAASFPWLLATLPLFFDMAFNGSESLRQRWSRRSTVALYGSIVAALIIGLLFMHCGLVNFIYFQF